MLDKPCIRGTRLTVECITGMIDSGMSIDEILDEYDGLEREDIEACILYATN
mgnify:CR=1 FL=1